jgi:RNA polymerase sigma factor (sigma-70 family)
LGRGPPRALGRECAREAFPRPSPNPGTDPAVPSPICVPRLCQPWTKTWSPHGVLHSEVTPQASVMNASAPTPPGSDEPRLLTQIQDFLNHRERGLAPSPEQEAAWTAFYDSYCPKIRKYAFSCGATEEEIADCAQEVWTELLVRLPTFRLDPNRGRFDSWLFRIVRGKTADILRLKRRLSQASANVPETAIEAHPNPARRLEDEEMVTLAWDQLRVRLSECNFRVLQMRLLEQRPVGEVAEKLGLSHEQVWYRYHRARRELEGIGSALARGRWEPAACRQGELACEETEKRHEFAQGNAAPSVSRNGCPSFLARHGGNCVDFVFQRLELGRRELMPEWKVEWNLDDAPRPILYMRKTAIVAYSEICGPGDFISAHWPRIVNAAIAAGVAAGIATIIATPTAALPIFQTEFHKHLHGKGGGAADDKVQVALSAKQEANGPWCACKG